MSMLQRQRAWFPLLAICVAVLLSFVGGSSSQADGEAAGAEAAPQPNVVVVMTDDQETSSYRREVMPRTTRLIARGGTTFTDYVVSTPLCCPSRAVALTGQYAHNNGVFTNRPGYGDLLAKESTLPTWLDAAGYHTAHFGKFLHGFEETAPKPTASAPGFDEWHSMLRPYGYFDFDLASNGAREKYRGSDYLSTVLTSKAVATIQQNAGEPDPLFLSVNYWAPHGTARSPGSCDRAPAPKPGDEDLFEDEELPRPPSFNERDVSDKPSFIQERPRLTRDEKRKLEHRYRCTLASLREVDRGVGDMYKALEATGEADNTVFVFTSDNGYYFGEHRLVGKSLPYEEGLRVPFSIRLPLGEGGVGQVRRVNESVANVDLVPTILELAGADPCLPDGSCRTLDGRSLTPLTRGEPGWPEGRAILLESRRNALDGESCRYSGLRTTQTLYVEHASVLDRRTGDCKRSSEGERYDLQQDPYELENLFPADTSEGRHTERELSRRLDALESCAGIDGRDAEGPGAYCE